MMRPRSLNCTGEAANGTVHKEPAPLRGDPIADSGWKPVGTLISRPTGAFGQNPPKTGPKQRRRLPLVCINMRTGGFLDGHRSSQFGRAPGALEASIDRGPLADQLPLVGFSCRYPQRRTGLDRIRCRGTLCWSPGGDCVPLAPVVIAV